MNSPSRKKQKTEEEEEGTTTEYPGVRLPDDVIFEQILPKVPAEKLMKCRSCCRLWNSTIQKDRHFLHLQSIKHRKVFIEEPLAKEDPRNALSVIKLGSAPHCFVIGDVEQGNCKLATASQIYYMSTCGIKGMTKEMTPFCYVKHPGAVNGLTCFRRYYEPDFDVCIFNISTRELTPWLKSIVKCDVDDLDDDLGFGYSPTTREYKLLWKWSTSHDSDMNNGPQGDIREVWEVLTVGKNEWRVIEDVVPFFVGKDAVSTYVNGTIYWLPMSGDVHYIGNLSLAAFDVQTETFRKIEIDNFDHGPAWEDEFGVCTHLLEVDGAITVLRRMNEDSAMLWKYHECNMKTTRETLNFPIKWDESCQYYFHTGLEKNHVTVELHQIGQRPRLYSCNLRLGSGNLFQEIQAQDWNLPLVDDDVSFSFFTFFNENLQRLSEGKEQCVHGVSGSGQAAAVVQNPLPQEEPTPDDMNATNIVIEMLDGSKIRRRFLESDKLQSVFDFISEKRRVEPGTYRLVRSFGHCESAAISLGDLGMTGKEEELSVQLL